MSSIRINVSSIIGKNSAILHSDGIVLYNELLKQKEATEFILSFEGVEYCTTAFLNSSVGKFLVGSKHILIKFEAADQFIYKIDLVIENARNEKKRNSLRQSSRGFLHA